MDDDDDDDDLGAWVYRSSRAAKEAAAAAAGEGTAAAAGERTTTTTGDLRTAVEAAGAVAVDVEGGRRALGRAASSSSASASIVPTPAMPVRSSMDLWMRGAKLVISDGTLGGGGGARPRGATTARAVSDESPGGSEGGGASSAGGGGRASSGAVGGGAAGKAAADDGRPLDGGGDARKRPGRSSGGTVPLEASPLEACPGAFAGRSAARSAPPSPSLAASSPSTSALRPRRTNRARTSRATSAAGASANGDEGRRGGEEPPSSSSSSSRAATAKEEKKTKPKDEPKASEKATAPPPPSHQVGDRIQAKYRGRGRRYYPGTIASVLSDNRYDVDYDDGDADRGLSAKFVWKLGARGGARGRRGASTAAKEEEPKEPPEESYEEPPLPRGRTGTRSSSEPPASAAPPSAASPPASLPSPYSFRPGALSADVVSYLQEWATRPAHLEDPYPTRAEKEEIARETGIDRKRLNTWFVNYRQRHWRPESEGSRRKAWGHPKEKKTTASSTAKAKRESKREKAEEEESDEGLPAPRAAAPRGRRRGSERGRGSWAEGPHRRKRSAREGGGGGGGGRSSSRARSSKRSRRASPPPEEEEEEAASSPRRRRRIARRGDEGAAPPPARSDEEEEEGEEEEEEEREASSPEASPARRRRARSAASPRPRPSSARSGATEGPRGKRARGSRGRASPSEGDEGEEGEAPADAPADASAREADGDEAGEEPATIPPEGATPPARSDEEEEMSPVPTAASPSATKEGAASAGGASKRRATASPEGRAGRARSAPPPCSSTRSSTRSSTCSSSARSTSSSAAPAGARSPEELALDLLHRHVLKRNFRATADPANVMMRVWLRKGTERTEDGEGVDWIREDGFSIERYLSFWRAEASDRRGLERALDAWRDKLPPLATDHLPLPRTRGRAAASSRPSRPSAGRDRSAPPREEKRRRHSRSATTLTTTRRAGAWSTAETNELRRRVLQLGERWAAILESSRILRQRYRHKPGKHAQDSVRNYYRSRCKREGDFEPSEPVVEGREEEAAAAAAADGDGDGGGGEEGEGSAAASDAGPQASDDPPPPRAAAKATAKPPRRSSRPPCPSRRLGAPLSAAHSAKTAVEDSADEASAAVPPPPQGDPRSPPARDAAAWTFLRSRVLERDFVVASEADGDEDPAKKAWVRKGKERNEDGEGVDWIKEDGFTVKKHIEFWRAETAGLEDLLAERRDELPPLATAHLPRKPKFAVGDVVFVQPRMRPGSNRPGGVAKVLAVRAPEDEPAGEIAYDVKYVLEKRKERGLEERFARAHVMETPVRSAAARQISAPASGRGARKSKRKEEPSASARRGRGTAKRCVGASGASDSEGPPTKRARRAPSPEGGAVRPSPVAASQGGSDPEDPPAERARRGEGGASRVAGPKEGESDPEGSRERRDRASSLEERVYRVPPVAIKCIIKWSEGTFHRILSDRPREYVRAKNGRKLCVHEGCTNLPRKRGMCERHGEKVKHHGGKQICAHRGCANLARQKGGVCNQHAAKEVLGDVKVGRKKTCAHRGCANLAQKGGACTRHRAKEVRRTILKGGKICAHRGCTFIARRKGGVCERHAAK